MSIETPQHPGSGKSPHLKRVLTIWVISSIIGIVADFLIFPAINPSSVSDVGHFSYLTNTIFTAMAMPVAMFVLSFVVYSIYTFRVKPGTPVDELEDGPHLQPSNTQQISWLAITTVLALLTVAWGMFGFFQQTTYNPPNPLVVQVTGQQWGWSYYYPAQHVNSNDLYLPVGVPVKLRIISDDVLHGFAIPQLGIAMDANPGRWVDAPIVKPTRTDVLYAHCIELCGLYHTYMWSKVFLVQKPAFAAWIKSNGGNATGPGVS